MLIRAARISDIHGSVVFAFASRPPYSLGAMDERVCVSGEGESPLGRAAWGGPRAWGAREGLRGAWIEKAQSGLALRGSALGWRVIRLTPQHLPPPKIVASGHGGYTALSTRQGVFEGRGGHVTPP